MKLINLTPHVIRVYAHGQIIVFPSQGIVRVDTIESEVDVITLDSGDTIPIHKTIYGKPQGLPEPQKGVMYIVSSVVLLYVDRPDLISPDTFKNAVRNRDGQIIGTKCFQTL